MEQITWEQIRLECAEQVPGRACRGCRDWKPAEDFELTPSGALRGTCRECRRAARRRPRHDGECPQCGNAFTKRGGTRFCSARCCDEVRRVATGEKLRRPFVGDEKRCTKCGEAKPVAEFWTRISWGREAPRSWCKSCEDNQRLRRLTNKAGYRNRRRVAPEGATLRLGRGYVLVKATGHQRANRGGWTYQHILVAEEKYGIPITRAFTVHHRNGDKADNRPENLDLRYGNHGIGADVIPALLRLPEMRAIARRVLAQYND